jgi:hypothetical protein
MASMCGLMRVAAACTILLTESFNVHTPLFLCAGSQLRPLYRSVVADHKKKMRQSRRRGNGICQQGLLSERTLAPRSAAA